MSTRLKYDSFGVSILGFQLKDSFRALAPGEAHPTEPLFYFISLNIHFPFSTKLNSQKSVVTMATITQLSN